MDQIIKNRLGVNMFDSEDREEELRKMEAEYKQFKEKGSRE